MENEKRKELTKYLKHGDRRKIAKLAKVSRQTVEKWLRGEVKESSAAIFIVKYAEKRKAEIEAIMEAQTELV